MSFKKLVSINLMVIIGITLGGLWNNSEAEETMDDVELLTIENKKLRLQLLEEDKQLQMEEIIKNYNEESKKQGFIQDKEYQRLSELSNQKMLELKKKIDEVNKLEEKKLAEYKAKIEEENRKKNTYYMEATAYDALCNTGCTGITATGLDVRNTKTYKGLCIVAVDPNVISLGSKLLVNGKECVAADTGGDIKGNRIDILMSSNAEAYKFGRQYNVEVIKIGEVSLR